MSTSLKSGVDRPADDALDTRAVPKTTVLARWLGNSGTWVLLLDLALIALFTVLSPDNVFWSLANFQALMLNATAVLLLALGVAMLLGAGAIDISVGANLVLSSVVGAKVMLSVAGTPGTDGLYPNAGAGIFAGLVACLLTGALFGLVNGIIIAYFDVNSLIATLSTLGIGTGVALLLTDGADIGGLPAQIQTNFGLRTIAGIPLPAVLALLVALVLWLVLRGSRFGVHTLAIGSLRLGAERAGLKVKRHLLMLAVLTGVLAGFAGFVSLAQYGATTVSGHANDPLAAITAVVIGGTLLEGGRVSITGAIWGTGLAVLLQGGLVVIGVAPFWQLIAIGAVLIAAVTLDRIRYRRRVAAR